MRFNHEKRNAWVTISSWALPWKVILGGIR